MATWFSTGANIPFTYYRFGHSRCVRLQRDDYNMDLAHFEEDIGELCLQAQSLEMLHLWAPESVLYTVIQRLSQHPSLRGIVDCRAGRTWTPSHGNWMNHKPCPAPGQAVQLQAALARNCSKNRISSKAFFCAQLVMFHRSLTAWQWHVVSDIAVRLNNQKPSPSDAFCLARGTLRFLTVITHNRFVSGLPLRTYQTILPDHHVPEFR